MATENTSLFDPYQFTAETRYRASGIGGERHENYFVCTPFGEFVYIRVAVSLTFWREMGKRKGFVVRRSGEWVGRGYSMLWQAQMREIHQRLLAHLVLNRIPTRTRALECCASPWSLFGWVWYAVVPANNTASNIRGKEQQQNPR